MGVLTERRAGNRALFVGGVVATAVVHAVIVGAALLGRPRANAHAARGPVFGTVVEVQAVKFGKPRDLSFLPHKEAPPPPRERPKIAVTTDVNARPLEPERDLPPPPPADDPLRNTRTDQFKHLADPDNTGTAVEEGDPNGLRGGTAAVGKGPVYLQHLVAAVSNAWVVPTTIRDAELQRLRALACIRIDERGRIVDYKLQTPSGNDAFDATLLNALGSLGQLEPPTDDVKAIVTGDGVCLQFTKGRE